MVENGRAMYLLKMFTGRFWMDNVYCDGTEDQLAKCRFDGWGTSDCESHEAAGVVCSHEEEVSVAPILKKKPRKLRVKDVHQQGMAIRLAGGRVQNEGRVEVKLGHGGIHQMETETNIRIKILFFNLKYIQQSFYFKHLYKFK